jgi:hypothetical protein
MCVDSFARQQIIGVNATHIDWKVERLIGSIGIDDLAWVFGIGLLACEPSVSLGTRNGFPKRALLFLNGGSLGMGDIWDPFEGVKAVVSCADIVVESLEVCLRKVIRPPVATSYVIVIKRC